MITPEQLRKWAQDADDGEDVALDGDTLRGIAEELEATKKEKRSLFDEIMEGFEYLAGP